MMLISDLPAPVTASKADWLPTTTWIGFTPQGRGAGAAAACQSAVARQFAKGYVLERVVDHFGQPNPGFEDDSRVRLERERHHALRDRLLAVHKLRHSARRLIDIVGREDFEHLQNTWDQDGGRVRWSVVFPVIETFEIISKPLAREVFGAKLFKEIYQHPSAGLRLLSAEAQAAIAGLEIRRVESANAWIAVEDEIAMADKSALDARLSVMIEQDLIGAMEGELEERRSKLRKRAVWLADNLIRERRKLDALVCDLCRFDPSKLPDANEISLRSCFDVHHKCPLEEGKRYTTISDLQLLCPTCHRLTHLRALAVMKGRITSSGCG